MGEPAAADALDVIARCPSLAATPRVVTGLPGGLTNRNYRVTTPGGAFVARLWAAAADGDLLAINRDHEYRNSVIAARAGVGAPVIEYRPDGAKLESGHGAGNVLSRQRRKHVLVPQQPLPFAHDDQHRLATPEGQPNQCAAACRRRGQPCLEAASVFRFAAHVHSALMVANYFEHSCEAKSCPC